MLDLRHFSLSVINQSFHFTVNRKVRAAESELEEKQVKEREKEEV